MTKLIIITGGIGSGKSVVSRLVSVMGFPTYDCDSEAKRIMNESESMRNQLIQLLGSDAYGADGRLNRQYVSHRIFAEPKLRLAMNRVVHPAVRDDLASWVEQSQSSLAFAETALLAESGLLPMSHHVWIVDAPEAVRIERVMQRSGLSAQQVKARIASQFIGDFPGSQRIINDGNQSLIAQVTKLLPQAAIF